MSDCGDEIRVRVAEYLEIPVENLQSFDIERDANAVTLTDQRVPHQSGSNDR